MNVRCKPSIVLTCLAPLLFACPSADAFKVVKNVNSDTQPVVKAVIFEKGAGPDQLQIAANDDCKTAINGDGELESRIVGHGEVRIRLKWKPSGELKETFDCGKVSYLLLTCRLEGTNHVAGPGGKVTDQRADNLWFPVQLFNAAGEPVGAANLADVTEDRKTPAKTVELRVPMSVLTYYGHDASRVAAIGFTWDKPRPGTERDFRLVIAKIALAD